MITLVDDKLLNKFSSLNYDNPFWCKISSLFSSYGYEMKDIAFWIQTVNEKVTAVIAKNILSAVVYIEEGANFSEIEEFLYAIGIETVTLDRKFLKHFNFSEAKYGIIMKYKGSSKQTIKQLPESCSLSSPKVKDIVDFLISSFPQDFNEVDYSNVYVDISHRIRHNELYALAVESGNKLMAIGMIVAETDLSAVIGAVYTAFPFRKKGIASYIVNSLLYRLKESNKSVYVFREKDKNKEFYIKLGFQDIDLWTEVKLFKH